MSPETIKARVTARQAAITIAELVLEDAKNNSPEAEPEFWKELHERLKERFPQPKIPPRKPLKPMTAAEAKRFEETTLPFGKHQGMPIGSIVETDLHYLDWLAGDYEGKRSWFESLRRYLLRPEIAQKAEELT